MGLPFRVLEIYSVVIAVKVPTQIVKRNGLIVEFDASKIALAIVKCYESIQANVDHVALLHRVNEYTDRVINVVGHRYETPTVEQVQDVVELVLQSAGEYDAAKHYILYRAERTRIRETQSIPPEIIEAYEEDDKYFPTALQRFQFVDKYSRWERQKSRRETWVETVDRAVDYLIELADNQNHNFYGSHSKIFDEIHQAILNMEVMPSMRLMAMAGEPARRDNSVLYNCSYLPIDSIDAFCEVMSNSMAGCGVGFSVEFENVDKLPRVQVQKSDEFSITTFDIIDSAEGWVEALRMGITCWFVGEDVEFDYRHIRPKGSPLKTKGGQASGPEPLRQLLSFIRDRFLARQGKKLTTLDCHDIACAIGNAVVSGGVRRTAMISLFDEDDELMLHCKDGNFADENPQRWNANNSAVWKNVDKMTQGEFVRRMQITFDSQRGEPGIFSREIAWNTMPDRRKDIYVGYKNKYGTNPCGEINLRPWQFCNLSIVVARPEDTLQDLARKVRLATIIGTIQSTATYFPNLRSIWKVNCEEERLLGVDITGQLDNRFLTDKGRDLEYVFSYLQQFAIETNKEYAEKLGINPSASITCNKPSGNSSQLLDCSSGIHARWAPYYIRNVRLSSSSPIVKVLQEAGVTIAPENGEDVNHPATYVISFPVKAPDGAITRNDRSAVDQCEWWLTNKKYWTEHNPSVTITYKQEEILDLLNWLWHNRGWISGMSFLPHHDAKYDQLPYIEISESEYNTAISKMPEKIDWSKIYLYEKDDHTSAAQELACESEICQLPTPTQKMN